MLNPGSYSTETKQHDITENLLPDKDFRWKRNLNLFSFTYTACRKMCVQPKLNLCLFNSKCKWIEGSDNNIKLVNQLSSHIYIATGRFYSFLQLGPVFCESQPAFYVPLKLRTRGPSAVSDPPSLLLTSSLVCLAGAVGSVFILSALRLCRERFLCFTREMKIAFCSYHHIAMEGCQWSHGMSEITENILNLIFCVRRTHDMLIAGLVKSLSWFPMVHRIRAKA